jgi:hypothetical protein
MDDLNIILPGNTTFLQIKKQKSLEKQINFKSLMKLNEDTFINPSCQTDLDEDRVQSMINSYLKNPEYFIFKNKITIGIFPLENEKKELLFLIDGQHRIEMAKKLYKDHDINDYFTLCYIKTYDYQEIIDIFAECNKDSYKNSISFDENILKQIKYIQLKEFLKKKYSESFSKTKAKANIIYSITEFIDILMNKIYPGDYHLLNIDELVNHIETKNKKFNKIIDYPGYLEETPDYFYKDEINCISNGITFVLKNNNFIDYLKDQTIIPDHIFKNNKSKISPKLRIQVWNTKFNINDNNHQNCPVYKCANIINSDVNGFQCGFIVSKHNNGELLLDNLTPLCTHCYNKMGSKNWEEFISCCKKEYKETKKVSKSVTN